MSVYRRVCSEWGKQHNCLVIMHSVHLYGTKMTKLITSHNDNSFVFFLECLDLYTQWLWTLFMMDIYKISALWTLSQWATPHHYYILQWQYCGRFHSGHILQWRIQDSWKEVSVYKLHEKHTQNFTSLAHFSLNHWSKGMLQQPSS